ncbi:MAG: hypothetical protein D6761_01950 [Candidatus Dadabacteria bacterium]|nr:MAG: hypothetical protein D6761_01950 [Candidatus Dadabacteria bacterium]
MNYIGSKYRLLEPILALLDHWKVPDSGTAVDPFCGTGAVAAALKARGHRVVAGDWQRYAERTAHALVCLDEPPAFPGLQEVDGCAEAPAFSASQRTLKLRGRAGAVLRHLDALPGKDGAFADAYAEGGGGGRLYFSQENGRRIQAIRDQIADWHERRAITDDEVAWLVASLIESADRVANTASVYGAYLKRLKKTAERPLRLIGIAPQSSRRMGQHHETYCCDAAALLERTAAYEPVLTYIDPPYNHRQYAGNYHVLETIACWDLDRFEPRGISGLRPRGEQGSPFCRRSQARDAFARLFDAVSSPWLLVSYNNEGLLDRETLTGLISREFAIVAFKELDYPRFRADRDRPARRYRADETVEYLILGRRR